MPCSRTRLRHSSTVGRLTPSFSAIATFCSPATAPKIIRQRRATCCGVPWADSHCSSCVRSAACKLIGKLVFGMLEIIATAVKYVKLFMIHYTSGEHPLESCPRASYSGDHQVHQGYIIIAEGVKYTAFGNHRQIFDCQ